MKIGYLKDAYPEQRCIINNLEGETEYIFCNEKFAKTRLKGKFKKILNMEKERIGWNALIYDPIILSRIDILHSFNHVCDINKPWVVTFESTIPRTNQTVERLWECNPAMEILPDDFTSRCLKLLLQKNCTKLIALSESAYQIQLNMLAHVRYPHIEELKTKMIVLHPPQECLVNQSFVHKKYSTINQGIKFLFVGRDFFGKGGAQLVKVLSKYEKTKFFHLTVVSELGYEGFASREERNYWETVLKDMPWITWIQSLSNDSVLDLCKKSHVGCLPTLQDTYGYSILEMQACGCPVITTDIRACPEINNSSCGWLVCLKKDAIGGEAIQYNESDKEE